MFYICIKDTQNLRTIHKCLFFVSFCFVLYLFNSFFLLAGMEAPVKKDSFNSDLEHFSAAFLINVDACLFTLKSQAGLTPRVIKMINEPIANESPAQCHFRFQYELDASNVRDFDQVINEKTFNDEPALKKIIESFQHSKEPFDVAMYAYYESNYKAYKDEYLNDSGRDLKPLRYYMCNPYDPLYAQFCKYSIIRNEMKNSIKTRQQKIDKCKNEINFKIDASIKNRFTNLQKCSDYWFGLSLFGFFSTLALSVGTYTGYLFTRIKYASAVCLASAGITLLSFVQYQRVFSAVKEYSKQYNQEIKKQRQVVSEETLESFQADPNETIQICLIREYEVLAEQEFFTLWRTYNNNQNLQHKDTVPQWIAENYSDNRLIFKDERITTKGRIYGSLAQSRTSTVFKVY